jgi:hypothetical protein
MTRILVLMLVCGGIVNGNSSMADDNSKPASFQLITLDPGHFHAALVQKFMCPDMDPLVHVYAPGNDDLAEHLKRIERFNTRAGLIARYSAETLSWAAKCGKKHWKDEKYRSSLFQNVRKCTVAGNLRTNE